MSVRSCILSCAALAAPAFVAISNAGAQLTIVASTTAFQDIRVSGTPIEPFSDDSETTLTPQQLTAAGWTGNSVFAGNVGVLVGNNGGMIWNPVVGLADQVGFNNSSLPGAASNSTVTGNGNGIRQFIAVFWDDHLPSTASPATELDWQVIDGDLLVQWSFEDNFDAIGPGRITFQARFYSQTHAGKTGIMASFVYEDTLYAAGQTPFNDGASTTIGYNGNGVGIAPGAALWSFNTAAVAGYSESANPNLPHALNLVIPTPGSGLLWAAGLVGLSKRRRRA